MIMRFNIRGENVETTQALRDYIIKKISRLERYFVNAESFDVNVSLRTYQHDARVEVTIPLTNLLLRAEETHSDMYAAIDLVLDKLER
jgi:putative sigma-54 modulation protein